MISGLNTTLETLGGDRMLVVGDRSGDRTWVDRLRVRYPDWTVATSESYLAGIADLSQHGAEVVLACVDASSNQLDSAVAGLREAAGPKAKLILCCTPETEPSTRSVLRSGADDYLIYPPDPAELDAALGHSHVDAVPASTLTAAPSASMEELAELATVLAGLDDNPRKLIDRVAALIRNALNAHGATVVVQGAAAHAGELVTTPVMTAPLAGSTGVIGQITVARRMDHPYTPADAQKLTHYAAVVGNIIEAAMKQRQWRRLSRTDECSGLPNRRYLFERLDEILARAAAEQFHVTLLLFDVDNFKTYNDLYGHDAGDQIIRTTGELFRKHCREQDIVVRYGGDEFVVVFWDAKGPRLAGSTHPECALSVLERFNEALKVERFSCLGPAGAGQLTISGGLATYPWDASTRTDLIAKADEALLAAKRAGKNRIFLIGDRGQTQNNQ